MYDNYVSVVTPDLGGLPHCRSFDRVRYFLLSGSIRHSPSLSMVSIFPSAALVTSVEVDT